MLVPEVEKMFVSHESWCQRCHRKVVRATWANGDPVQWGADWVHEHSLSPRCQMPDTIQVDRDLVTYVGKWDEVVL